MKKLPHQRLPKFVRALYMECLGQHLIHPSVPEVSSIIDSEPMNIALFLLQCQKIYDRNMVQDTDSLIIETEDDFAIMFHLGHVCLHQVGRHGKLAHFPAPLGANATEIAQTYLRVRNLEPEL